MDEQDSQDMRILIEEGTLRAVRIPEIHQWSPAARVRTNEPDLAGHKTASCSSCRSMLLIHEMCRRARGGARRS